jgi:hypothetical protein
MPLHDIVHAQAQAIFGMIKGMEPQDPYQQPRPTPATTPLTHPQPVYRQPINPAPQPIPDTDPYIGLTGSQIYARRTHLPIGLYVIAGLQLIGFGLSFFNTGETGIIVSVAMLLQLMLAIGLLLRIQAARKAMLAFSVVLIALSIVGGLTLFGLQQRIHKTTANYTSTLQKLGDKTITPSQQKDIDALRATISNAQKQAGNAITVTYAGFGFIAAENLLVVAYLVRPMVRDIFNGNQRMSV